MEISFFVPGKPAPGGSKKAFYNKKLRRSVIVDDAKNNAGWKQDVKVFGRQAYDGPLLAGPLSVCCMFHIERPRYHFGTGKNAGKIKPAYIDARPTSKPDATKLFRSTEDALTGVIWQDDAQVVEQHIWKVFSSRPGAEIKVVSL